MQRIMDRLSLFEYLKMTALTIWELLTFQLKHAKEYVHNSETNVTFVEDEINSYRNFSPSLAETIVNERDEYLAQSIIESANVLTTYYEINNQTKKTCNENNEIRLVAVVGLGHLKGIKEALNNGGVNRSRIHEISISNRNNNSCWPGPGIIHTVN
jgi:pheromone shutdown protein TraB